MRYLPKLLLAMIVTVAATAAHADDWPQWLGPKRDGSSAEIVKPWKEPLKILWKMPLKGEGHGGPIVAAGKVYLFSGLRKGDSLQEQLETYDADNGKRIWDTAYPRATADFAFGNGPRGVPIVDGDRVYTFGITSVLQCYETKSGKILWTVSGEKEYKAPRLKFGSSCSPVVVGDHVLVNMGAKGASIVAFDKTTGKEVWKKLDDGATYSSPVAIPSARSVVFLTAKGLVSLSPKDGAIHWQYPFVDFLLESSCTPLVINDQVLASSITGGSVLVKDEGKDTAKKVWAKGYNCYFSTPLAVGKDMLFLVTGSILGKSATLRCVDPETGNELWTRKNVGAYHATLLRTGDGKVLMVEEKGDLVLIDPNRKAYTELARTTICGNTWAHPALANGRLYIRDAKELVCVELPK
jgi:outer membrane protein assembly factor BamB